MKQFHVIVGILCCVYWPVVYATCTTFSTPLYNGVIPTNSEMQAICGPYFTPTPTFQCCTNTSNVYTNCINNPFACSCTIEAPARFQLVGGLPCGRNYGVFPCVGSDVSYFCGPNAASCTKRCDYLGNCYQVNTCTCNPGYTFPENPFYCSYAYQADQCLTLTSFNPGREIATCGVYTSLASFLCPYGNNSYNPNDCTPLCSCLPGTGQTPGSNIICDGLDRPCNSADVLYGCGSQYANCTKRCQYTNINPSIQGNCVILPNSCVLANATIPVSGVFPCTSAQTTACGPATARCTQTITSGVVTFTTCYCTASGFNNPIGFECDQWIAYRAVTQYSICTQNCGAGYINGSTYPCQYRQFWTPAPPISGSPTFTPTALYTANQLQQMWWLTQPVAIGPATLPAMLTWNQNTLSWQDNLNSVQAYWNITNINNPTMLFVLMCTCDSTPLAAAANFIAQNEPAAGDLSQFMSSTPAGFSATYRSFQQFVGGTSNVPTWALPLTSLQQQFILYPGAVPALVSSFGDFYTVLSCAGPSVTAPAQVWTNTMQQYSQLAENLVIMRASVGTTWSVTTTAGTISSCQALTMVNPALPVTLGWVVQTFAPYPFGTWVFTVLLNNFFTFETYSCPAIAFNGAYISQLLGAQPRQGQISYRPPSLQQSLYVNVANLYSAVGNYSQIVCNNQGYPSYDIPSKNGVIPSYLPPTLGSDTIPTPNTMFPMYTVAKWNGDTQGLFMGWGPVTLTALTAPTCICQPGWGGVLCNQNLACNPSYPEPANPNPCALISGFDPSALNRWLVVYQYDYWFNGVGHGALILSSTTCSYSPGVPCNLALYYSVAQQFCAHGTFNPYTSMCAPCNPGWTWPNNLNTYGCTQPAPVNCVQFQNTTQPCNGFGTLDPTGNCICNNGTKNDAGGNCCTASNTCTDCSNAPDSHVMFCNQTATSAVNVCEPGATGGFWTGPCCQSFQFYGACNGYASPSGEAVFTYNSNTQTLVPVPFPGTGPINPDGTFCVCGSETNTGVSCQLSSCPSYNGQVCNGLGTCVNGQCMQNGVCQGSDFFGCACQYDITASCKGLPGAPLCSNQGSCVTTPAVNVSLECVCENGYTGQYCATSPCDITDCNAVQTGGQCALVNGTYQCLCYGGLPPAEADFRPCTGNANCVFAGPTCGIDVTTTCGVELGLVANICNRQGVCNVTNSTSIPAQANCQCINGWTSTTNYPNCQTQPCNPACGPHGICNVVGGIPQCDCVNSLWYPGYPLPPVPPFGPCAFTTCIYGYPSSDLIGAVCVCNNTAYSYSSQCKLLNCAEGNGVQCGQVNCALQLDCWDGTQCKPGCYGSTPQNTCFNGTCTCERSSIFNPNTSICESRCGPYPQTNDITLNNDGTVTCICDPQYSQPDNCFLPICLNGGFFNTDTQMCECAAGWSGNRCQNDYCGGHGTFNASNTAVCTCFFPFTGQFCDMNQCGIGIPDVDEGFPYSCTCPSVYYGRTCEFNRCINGHPTLDGSACVCNSGWSSPSCGTFDCFYPNVATANNTCQCTPDYYGTTCQYPTCGVAGSNINGSCVCGGVSDLRPCTEPGNTCLHGQNCTGNLCGPHGLPSTNMATCLCTPCYTLVQPNANYSVWCVPPCHNGGVYNDLTTSCTCPAGTIQPFCNFEVVNPSTCQPYLTSSSSTGVSSSSSSSTGAHFSSSTALASSSSTGTHRNTSSTGVINDASNLRTPIDSVVLLTIISFALLAFAD